MDFDFDMENILPIVLALLGALVAVFTASGGFSSFVTGEKYDSGLFIKLAAGVGGGVIGYVWGHMMTR